MKRSLLPLALLSALNLAACDDDDTSAATSDAALTSADASADVGADADVFAACEGERLALDQCYRGAAFAECGGSGEPAVFCDMNDPWGFGGQCLWFTGGCPAVGYDFPKAHCESEPCLSLAGYDSPPQTRATDQRVSVQVGVPATTATSCETTGSAWEPCDFPSESMALSDGGFAHSDPPWGWPSNLSWLFFLDHSAEEEPAVSLALVIELPPGSDPLTARVCLTTINGDVPDFGRAAECDDAEGTITLSHVPTTAAERDTVSMSFDLTLPLSSGGTIHWVGSYAPDTQAAKR